MKKYSLIITFSLLFHATFSQSKSELKKAKKKIEQEIKITSELLEKTKKNKLKSLNYLNILTAQIQTEEKLINTLELEIKINKRKSKNISKKINRSNNIILEKKKELDHLKKNYSKIIYSYNKNKGLSDQLMFIVSANDFNQAYRRFLYVKQYTNQRKKYVKKIITEKNNILAEIEKLEKIKKELSNNIQKSNTLFVEKNKSLENTFKKREEKEELISELAKSENFFKSEIKNKQAKSDNLDKKIRKIIEEEIRKERDLAKKRNKKGRLTPESQKLTRNFVENKQKLPWPVESGVISDRFGTKKHQVFSEVETFNNGVDIITNKDELVRSVFDGNISRIFVVKGEGKAILIAHGEYFTVYSGLKEVYVETGESVMTNEKIGKVSFDEETQRALLHFEIWRGYEKIDPSEWIYDLY